MITPPRHRYAAEALIHFHSLSYCQPSRYAYASFIFAFASDAAPDFHFHAAAFVIFR